MTNTMKLHTAARRYCIERGYFWRDEYSKVCDPDRNGKKNGYHYTDEAYDIFPRYNVLDAILIEVEKHNPEEFESLEYAKNELITTGLCAESSFTKPSNGQTVGKIIIDELKKGTYNHLPLSEMLPKLFELAEVKSKEFPEPRNNEVQEKAMNKEKYLFCKFISDLTEADLSVVEPMFYRRVISETESDMLRKELSIKWCEVGSYWYPLIECNREDIVAFTDDFFDEDQDIERLREILKRHGIYKIYQLREFDSSPEYELDTDAFYPFYTIDGEGYWCSNEMDWVIYASHENSITIAGTWLVDEVKLAWKDWKQRIWSKITY
ncbi:hypothetical protein [Ruminiclostridium cellobioparum]|uniref:Uncharacterized protein n=1 Tax=Ruminiclostridium cellobioparum subsp. termitidis CT1112 TaxID=1195236 RepID=S0FQ42_RUMCE|nr:hypothetical protein [Ruminiclostridium cellobioparum]EMS71294.1 hypothetical protein CTER_2873 [Ruminiclostridium cellobioparum subsp. termitidis CT1112]